ncbi:hypothetical protein RN001_005008 [Aquatica leii]|uniref:LRRCT domain-containing protein n=1 Tax=Aquatica leii TaxID=1421715 RepID=A0AAN7PZA1_9COLE|nr:hypothetical protein RN001_005008 [Aquatica leii]
MNIWIKILFLAQTIWTTQSSEQFVPCYEVSRELRFPCKCLLGPAEAALDGDPAVAINCDKIVFAGDFPAIPYGAPVVSYSQRWTGHQSLPTQIFTTLGLPLRTVDFSGNALRRLTERLLQGLRSTLIELRLADNLLGDTLNPIFSTNEFHTLKFMQVLDLSGNGIKAIEEGIFEGCESLQELYLNRNSFYSVPTSSLNGPKALKVLGLRENRIGVLKRLSFHNQKSLEKLDLSNNLISTIESGSLENLENLKILKLTHNKLKKFNSDVFQGADNLERLDLAENIISEFPEAALKAFTRLRYLNLSSNLIQALDNNMLTSFVNLHDLDLSRNNIANIVPGTFLGLKNLKHLDISVNSLRTIEDDAFEGLDNLETLRLNDNNILLIPASAIGRLPRLNTLQLDYNRVAALSAEILKSIADQVKRLVIAKNVVRELPAATFQYFQQLDYLDLSRNLITNLNSDAFIGLESTLKELHLSQNRINSISGAPLTLSKLEILDLSDNQLVELSKNAFNFMPSLKFLNLSQNNHLTSIPSTLLHKLTHLQTIDFSHMSLKSVPTDIFEKSLELRYIYLNNNDLTELLENSFLNLRNLTAIDLSYNNINTIKSGTFVNIMNVQKLLLKGNQLNSFKGEFFNTGTGLEVIDISQNHISYLFPSSFRIHPRLRELHAAHNKFNFFPAELIATLQFLEYIDLSGNELKTLEELDFARLPRLRSLILAQNEIDSVSEMAFHNSTQLQVIDLSNNRLERLGERTFEGLIRIKYLNLEKNLLKDLPETIFERAKLQMLENINLAWNLFEVAPWKSLQRQYFFVSSVDISHNKIREIPTDNSIMINIKKIDLSFNPLSEEAINNVLGEPKTVRELNLAGTGISRVIQMETPFLHHLNLSHNNISELSEKEFERITLLETLDLSYNNLSDLNKDFPKIWSVLKNLQQLDLSGNLLTTISQNDFDGLETLRHLNLIDLKECNRLEKNAFKSVPNLAELNMYNLPVLGYLDVHGLLQNLPSLEKLNIEIKDSAVGSDQLQTVLHSRLKELGLWGSRLHSISSGTLSGVKGSNVMIRLQNTSISSLPPSLFFPVPRSSRITLDVTGSKLTTISPQMLSALDDRRGDLKIIGLETNPIMCDCTARALRRWLPAHMTMIRCSRPDFLKGKLLVEIGDDELTCDTHKQYTTQSTTMSSSRTTRLIPKTTEPEIIWSIASTDKIVPKVSQKTSNQSSNNDDTLIIGIVGGVVAFIAILIIVICMIRLRMTQNQYRGGPLASAAVIAPPGMGTGSNCACSVKGAPPAIYAVPSSFTTGYASTLPHKFNMSGQPNIRPAYSTMGRVPYYQNNVQSYYVAFPPDDKTYR